MNETEKNIDILVNLNQYDIKKDKRILIPFRSGHKFGFMNREGTIIIPPRYNKILGEAYSEADLIKVAVSEPHHVTYQNNNDSLFIRDKWGIINGKGETVIIPQYNQIGISDDNRLFSIQNLDYQYGVIDINGNEIIPFGKYRQIYGFKKGFTRVRKFTTERKEVWGLIDENENEILPFQYDYIWEFDGELIDKIKVKKRM